MVTIRNNTQQQYIADLRELHRLQADCLGEINMEVATYGIMRTIRVVCNEQDWDGSDKTAYPEDDIDPLIVHLYYDSPEELARNRHRIEQVRTFCRMRKPGVRVQAYRAMTFERLQFN